MPPRRLLASPSGRLFTSPLRRTLSTQPPASTQPPPSKPSTSAASARRFSALARPWLRVFLGAFLTYQLLYLGWEKMRHDEIKAARAAELRALEAEVRAAAAEKQARPAEGTGWARWFGWGGRTA